MGSRRRAERILLVLTLLACWAGSRALAAGTYKWVDEKGVTHYSDTLPPQYVRSGNTVLDQRQLPKEIVPPAPTAEQIRQRELQERERAEQERLREDKKRDQFALLALYSSADEVDRVRDRNLAPILAKIDSAQDKLKHAKQERTEIDNELEFYAGRDRNGKLRVVPTDLQHRIDTNRAEQKSLLDLIDALRGQESQLRTRFDEEKRRYIEARQAQLQGDLRN